MKYLKQKDRAILAIVLLAIFALCCLYVLIVPGYSKSLTYERERDEEENLYSIVKGIKDKEETVVVIPPRYSSIVITHIGEGAFKDCTNIKSVKIPSTVTHIGKEAFSGCTSLESITIPANVTTIGENAFVNCPSLKRISVSSQNQNYKSIDGDLYTKDGKTLIKYTAKKVENSFEIPHGVEQICTTAFDTSAKNVTIPASVTSISTAFAGLTTLETVIFEKGTTIGVIGLGAFKYCTGLKSIQIPASVEQISFSAFQGCKSLQSVTFEQGSKLNYIDSYAFSGCSSLETITVPVGVTKIGWGAFSRCTSLKSVLFSANNVLETIDQYAFMDCTSLANIQLPQSTTSIWKEAFANCTSLTELTIPQSVEGIGVNAFSGCTNLTSVYFESRTWNVRYPNGSNLTTIFLGSDSATTRAMAAEYLVADYADREWRKVS